MGERFKVSFEWSCPSASRRFIDEKQLRELFFLRKGKRAAVFERNGEK